MYKVQKIFSIVRKKTKPINMKLCSINRGVILSAVTGLGGFIKKTSQKEGYLVMIKHTYICEPFRSNTIN